MKSEIHVHRIAIIPLFALVVAATAGVDDTQSTFKLGERFFNDSLYNLALEQYQKFITVKRSPENDPAAYYKIGLCYYKMKNLPKAADAFSEYLKLFPSDENVQNALFFSAAARKSMGDYKEASELFYQVWDRFVGSAQAQRALFESAACAEKDNNAERAIELYDTFYRKFPKHDKLRGVALALARLLIDQKEYGRAAEVLKKGDDLWSGDKDYRVRSLYFKARLNRRMQKPDEAESDFAAMLKAGEHDFPEFEQACGEYIDLLRDRQDQAGSLKVYQVLAGFYRQKGVAVPRKVLAGWADVARQARAFDQAEDLYTQLLKLPQDSVNQGQVLLAVGECQIGKGDITRAIETLQSVVLRDSLGEYGIRAILRIGDAYYDNELFVSAIAAYQRYLSLPEQPNSDAIVFKIGTIYKDKFNHYATALREFENLVKRYPASPYRNRALFAIGECSEALGDFAAAASQYGYFVESGSQDPLVDSARGRIAYLKAFRFRDTEKALFDLADLLRRSVDSLSKTDRLCALAAIYSQELKDYDKSNAIYQEIRGQSTPPPDSLLAGVEYHIAENFERLCEKASYEHNGQLADYDRKQSLGLYADVVRNHPQSPWADDAAFHTLSMSTANIAEYEHFAVDYPNSLHAAEVLFDVGQHYEKRARAGDVQFAKKAIEAYATLVKKFPANPFVPRAMVGLAQNELMLGNVDSAMAAAEVLKARFAGTDFLPEGLLVQGVVFRSRSQYLEAIEAFKHILYQYPFSPLAGRARYELAEAQFETKKIFEASSNFAMYLQANPNGPFAPQARLGSGRCFLALGNFGEAQRTLEQLLKEKLADSLQARTQFELAQVSEKQNDVNRALELYHDVLSHDSFGNKGDVYLHVAGLEFENRLYDDAIIAYEKAVSCAVKPVDSMRALRGDIIAMIMAGKGKDADRKIAGFNDRFGDSTAEVAEIVYYEGLHLVVEKEYDKAINRFKYILAKYDESDRADDAAYEIALATYYDNRKDAALGLFGDFARQYPQSEYVPLAQFKIAMIYHEQADFAHAAEYFVKAVDNPRTDPKTRFRACYNAAVDYQKTSSWVDAAAMYKKIINDFPDETSLPAVYLKAGFCLFQGSRFDDALSYFEKANINPASEDKPEIIYWLASCYAHQGDLQKAVTEYLKVPYLYSGIGKWGITAEFEAARLYERQGDYDRAQSIYKRIVKSDGENGEFGKGALARMEQIKNLNEGATPR